ncbi:hypothetical protein Gbro_2043 [Gordonia bronchialis DSM 43247]|jgi:hypothetical protein|uniref:Uncharacterized protein n=1 Tax=Gordonia bronchialis (strain ATCC 25592 / DSM 43247 / BCRC 13721 / JCM 3198 / KCTC 3076 / NBRC 16047 / NCTC 10667) TaxID=526226 RepID=D0LAI2_GORB4|nr:hypothetical protein [Gordonia bronchialis]ACY21295.1 hypothetical protein Gbro_2043 [Gordonia bronchialis DSM 43247]MCC3324079.1 hypothetical protein [Gordonia bronchialis]UAK38699.1 hypothetical protein K8O93_02650 [Gordonia bronchialis]STQ64169.1 Uncharacterised protein [Gordonia bronchialis]
MSLARVRARLLSTDILRNDQRRLYADIARVPSRTQRDELLVMAQRAEAS